MTIVKSARFSCDAIIEIVTPENVGAHHHASGKAVGPDHMVNDDNGETAVGGTTQVESSSSKPKWYPGPEQVQGWGYLHNMGYPEYYRGSNSGPVDCRWTIRATHGRRVRLTLLDLSIRSITDTIIDVIYETITLMRSVGNDTGVLHDEKECKDVVTVTEHSRLLLNKCGQVEEPLVIESFSDEINITLSVKSQFIPKRGLMAYFTGQYQSKLISISIFITCHHRVNVILYFWFNVQPWAVRRPKCPNKDI